MHTTRRGVPVSVALLGVILVGACEDKETKWVSGDAGGDASSIGFLETCEEHAECASGKCLTLGGTQRCSRACGAGNPCPEFEPWRCEGGFCTCSAIGPSDRCNVDGDCDGVPEHPAVDEKCNGEDDDCNDVIDDVGPGAEGAKRYFRDADGDGYGDVNEGKWMCAPVVGWVENSGDCNDDREEDNPEAEEVCGDTFDNDCDGRLEDADLCGSPPIVCPQGTELEDPACMSAVLKDCDSTPGVEPSFDVEEIVFKQDATRIKFTVRIAGSPISDRCAAYRLSFGDLSKTEDELVYIYRLPRTLCDTAGLPQVEAYHQGTPIATTAVTGFLPATPGHVYWIVDKSEIFPRVPMPTYRVRACTNAVAGVPSDPNTCTTDTCEARIHQ